MPSSPQARQLSDGDAIFLAMETGNAGGHIGSLLVLDPATNPDFDFDFLARRIEERVALLPRFSWRLHEIPFGLDRPYWVQDESFDAREHIYRAAVPKPGSLEQVAEIAGRLHARPLDRSRPLWEAWLIEGLEGGRYALYMKVHHCLMDGASGVGLGEILSDLTPDATAPIVPEVLQESAPIAPSTSEIASNKFVNSFGRRKRLAEHFARGVQVLARDWGTPDAQGLFPTVPRLFFNGAVGPRRGLATTALPLDRILALKKHFDVKLNDVVLQVVGTAMRRYLRERGELPDEHLVATCPVSTRSADDGTLDNQLTNMSVSLGTDHECPVERLQHIHASATRAKVGLEKGGFDVLAALGESLAPGAVGWLMRGLGAAPEQAPLPGNFVVSNVRATPVPLYMAGARIESLMPMSLLQSGQGLNVTVVSYTDRLDVGITVDPDVVPDAWSLAEQFPAALEELESAASGVRHVRRLTA
jgi:WS/DGAT/MGAT family acyltransferase